MSRRFVVVKVVGCVLGTLLVAGTAAMSVASELDPVTAQIRKLELLGAESCPAPLWRYKDPTMQGALETAIAELGLSSQIDKKRLSVVLVDVTDQSDVRVAELNGDVMMYAASPVSYTHLRAHET